MTATRLWGIDVSYHNGNINWERVKESGVQFAMLRAGFSNSPDVKFEENAKECERLNIPYGVYWFSYAYTMDMAKKEATACLRTIQNRKISFPVVFDFEYSSVDFAKKNYHTVTGEEMVSFAKVFLQEIENAGYYAMNYTNMDFLTRGFNKLCDRFDTWLARWKDDISDPGYPCGIWQYSSTGEIPGIKGKVDLNFAFKDYAKKEKTKNEYAELKKETLQEIIKEIEVKLTELKNAIGD